MVFHPSGYVGRLLNWDLDGITLPMADLMAVPAALLIEEELGQATCVKIAVWDLGTTDKFEVSGVYALGQAASLRALIDRADPP